MSGEEEKVQRITDIIIALSFNTTQNYIIDDAHAKQLAEAIVKKERDL